MDDSENPATRKAKLVMDLTTMSNDDLTAALAEKRKAAEALFALTPTIERANAADELVASIKDIEAEMSSRKEALKRFDAAKVAFSESGSEDEGDEPEDTEDDAEVEEDDSEDEDDAEDEGVEEGDEGAEPVEAALPDEEDLTDDEDDDDDQKKAALTASKKTPAKRVSAAQRVGSRVPKSKAPASPSVVITAAADVPEFGTGTRLDGMTQVAQAAVNRAGGFSPFNRASAEAIREQYGDRPMLRKFGVASFGVDVPKEFVASQGEDYNSVQAARKEHVERLNKQMDSVRNGKSVVTAAGWCPPSEVVYSWIADYQIDGLLTLPEVSAPRGGLMTTTGPALAQTTYADPANFGFGGTEAEAIAGDFNKECAVIECPSFDDHRLDYDGYCYKIPLLTEAAYPELIADAMRLADVLYAHRLNKRFIGELVTMSTALNALDAKGGTLVDTLEAFTQVAIKERRWWNIGENALMEIKLPQVAREIFKFDMARRNGLALNDIATDQKLAAHFANHNFAVEYVSDWQELTQGVTTVAAQWPETITGLIYPAGAFAKAIKPVVNLSAVYDAASLAENEYTGVFFEQGVMTLQLGYRSHAVTIPVCNAGRTGAADLTCITVEPEPDPEP